MKKIVWLLILAVCCRGVAGEQRIYPREGAGFQVNDGQLELAADGQTHVTLGTAQTWPGAWLGGRWDLRRFRALAATVENRGEFNLELYIRVDNPGADGTRNCLTRRFEIAPGQTATLEVPLLRQPVNAEAASLGGMNGYPPEFGTVNGLDLENITNLLFFVAHPQRASRFSVVAVKAIGESASAQWTGSIFPLVDAFGQYKHGKWLGKIQDIGELRASAERERADWAAHPRPVDVNRFGGWTKGPQLPPRGFFYPAKWQGKHYLVDPEGRLFFSLGVNCVGSNDFTPITFRDRWFETLAAPESPAFYGRAWPLHNTYAGKEVRTFNFANHNLFLKYGPDWAAISARDAHDRLASWGLNTIANWSDSRVAGLRRTPYVVATGIWGDKVRKIAGSEGYWTKFTDVFDPAFPVEYARSFRSTLAQWNSAADPMCIGYFADNELGWGDATSLALGALNSPPDQPARIAFRTFLQAQYPAVGDFNAAWRESLNSWADFDAVPRQFTAAGAAAKTADLRAFNGMMIERYFRTIREVIKKYAPDQLYLGCRFDRMHPDAFRIAARYVDVISFNAYRYGMKEFALPENLDFPVLITEFHFGAPDRGMWHGGLTPAVDQADRAARAERYIRECVQHPQIVGCHWFQYRDEPLTGRALDGENYSIGLVSTTDQPYPELVAVFRAIGNSLYRLRSESR